MLTGTVIMVIFDFVKYNSGNITVMHSFYLNIKPISNPIKIASYCFGNVSDLLFGFCLTGYTLSLEKKICISYDLTTVIDK